MVRSASWKSWHTRARAPVSQISRTKLYSAYTVGARWRFTCASARAWFSPPTVKFASEFSDPWTTTNGRRHRRPGCGILDERNRPRPTFRRDERGDASREFNGRFSLISIVEPGNSSRAGGFYVTAFSVLHVMSQFRTGRLDFDK